MSAEVETMFSVKMPWHGHSNVTGEVLTGAEAIRAAKLDWEVEAVPLRCEDTGALVLGHAAIRRQSDQRVFGVVGREYVPIQNQDIFDMADAFLQEEAQFTTAGALYGGRIVWVCAQLKGYVDAGTGDSVLPYLVIYSSHDGSLGLTTCLNPIEPVCANTLRAAIRAQQRSCKIRHSAGWFNKVAEAKRILGLARDIFGELAEGMHKLATVQLADRAPLIVDRMIPLPGKDVKGAKLDFALESRGALTATIARPIGSVGRGGHGTLLQAWSGITEFADHHWMQRRHVGTAEEQSERRMADLLLEDGPRTEFKERGWAVLQDMVA